MQCAQAATLSAISWLSPGHQTYLFGPLATLGNSLVAMMDFTQHVGSYDIWYYNSNIMQ